MTASALSGQLVEVALGLFTAPLLLGWVNQCRARLQNRRAPDLLLPLRGIEKLLHKDAVVADNASPLFRLAPYLVFGCMVVVVAIVPALSTNLPLSSAADAIALVGLLALARTFMALAALDVGTAFGGLGARREMMLGFLAEPALLMVLFAAATLTGTTSLAAIVERIAGAPFAIHSSLAVAAIAFALVSLGENARIPVDNPATHLELTMIHEALLLEYSARHLALLEWAAALKLYAYSCIGLALFCPWGIATSSSPGAVLLAVPALALKLALGGLALALVETLNAKMRLFLVPEFLVTAFLLAVIALLTQTLLGG